MIVIGIIMIMMTVIVTVMMMLAMRIRNKERKESLIERECGEHRVRVGIRSYMGQGWEDDEVPGMCSQHPGTAISM